MPVDCTFSTPEGVFNYRVGAIIRRDGTLLAMKEEGLEVSLGTCPGGGCVCRRAGGAGPCP